MERNIGRIINDALSNAVVTGKSPIARALLQEGADVEGTTTEGDTLLAAAVRRKDQEMVKLLLEWGAVRMSTDADGLSLNDLVFQHGDDVEIWKGILF
jgi:hypothetical protein